MPKARLHIKTGFSIVEALLAGSLFSLAVSVFIAAIIYGQESTQSAGSLARAANIADEALEATRNIRDNAFSNLTLGDNGLATSSNQWVFSGTQDIVDIFTRQVNVALSGLGSGSRSVTATTTWPATSARSGEASVFSYLTNWRGCRGGILVYGDGGLSTDAIKYKVLQGDDRTNCTWSAAQSAADIDAGSANRGLMVVQVYASATRNEKIMVSRHMDSTSQYIYAQVFKNGAWGDVVLLSSWVATTFLSVQNFSGTYLANGDFIVVYSDNTTLPRFRTWNGSAWSTQVSTQNIGGIPTNVIARARPGTNEVMAAFLDQQSDTNTQYFNGGSYIAGNWTLHAEHATTAKNNFSQLIDFAWSPNNSLIAGFIYSTSTTDRSLHIKIWTANGVGGGLWSAVADTTLQGNNSTVIVASAIVGRPGANEFDACDVDSENQPRIFCYKSNFTPTWTNPTNQTLTINGDLGTHRTFHLGFESISGDPAINVYSDRTTIPKLKKFTASSATWDVSATNLNTLGGGLKSIRIIPHPGTDEMMILMGDANIDLYSLVWDGANNTTYTTPSGYAFTTHGINGSAIINYWYDFAWDLY